MTRIEKSSQRKCRAIRNLVEANEYSPSYGLLLVEQFYDSGKIIESDYDEICEYLEELLNKPVEEEIEEVEEIIEEPIEEPIEETGGE